MIDPERKFPPTSPNPDNNQETTVIDPKILEILDGFCSKYLAIIQAEPDRVLKFLASNRRGLLRGKDRLPSLPEFVIIYGLHPFRDAIARYMIGEHESVNRGSPADNYLGGVVEAGEGVMWGIKSLSGEVEQEISSRLPFIMPRKRQTEVGFSEADIEAERIAQRAEYVLTEQLLREDSSGYAVMDYRVTRLTNSSGVNPYTIRGAEMAAKVYKALYPLARQLFSDQKTGSGPVTPD